jgi:hypothetical protein
MLIWFDKCTLVFTRVTVSLRRAALALRPSGMIYTPLLYAVGPNISDYANTCP